MGLQLTKSNDRYKKVVIVSPHADDEIIGCFSLLILKLVKKVIYVDITPQRLILAKRAGIELGFVIQAVEFGSLYSFLQKEKNEIFFVPDVMDNHPLHKAVNLMGRMSGCQLGYYTTDMNTGYTRELSDDVKNKKRKVLNEYYPDQSTLWENNWKYFLFEGTVYDTSSPPNSL